MCRFPPPGRKRNKRASPCVLAELARWWTKFNDPLLDSLVERAVQVQSRSAVGGSAHTRGPGIACRDRFRRLADGGRVGFVHA